MSESNTQTASSGVGVGGLLGVLFVGLKLVHVIDWSWLWVLSPFWIPASVVLVIILACLAVIVVVSLLKS